MIDIDCWQSRFTSFSKTYFFFYFLLLTIMNRVGKVCNIHIVNQLPIDKLQMDVSIGDVEYKLCVKMLDRFYSYIHRF